MSVGSIVRDVKAFFPSRGEPLAPQAREIYLNALAGGKMPDQADVATLQSLGTKYLPGAADSASGAGQIVKGLPKDSTGRLAGSIKDAIRNAGSAVGVKLDEIIRNWKQDNFPSMLDNVLEKQTKALNQANAVVLSKKEGVRLAEGGVKQWEGEVARLQKQLAAATDPAEKANLTSQVGRAQQQLGIVSEKLVAMQESLHAFETEYKALINNVRATQINVGILKNEWQQSRDLGKLTDAAEKASKSMIDINDDIVLMQARRAEADAKAMAKLRKLNEQEVSLDPLRPKPSETPTPPTTPPTA